MNKDDFPRTTIHGEEWVLIPRFQFEVLWASIGGEALKAVESLEEDEEAADIAMYDSRTALLREGRDLPLPPEVSAAMLRGDTLIKALRKWRDRSQIELANAAGLGQGYLSDLEAGRRKGTAETLGKIAAALDIDPAWLLTGKDRGLKTGTTELSG